ncbi:MAG: hypothetical protein ACREE7_10870 [Dongiaceae bacterium]
MAMMLAVALLPGCKGEDAASRSSFCQTIGGGGAQASEVCSTNCSQDNIAAAVDGSFETYATITVSVQSEGVLRGTAQNGVVFPQGKFAGVYLHKPPLATGSFQLTVNTYLDGVPKDSEVAFGESGGTTGLFCNFMCVRDGDNLYIGVPTSAPFDAIEIGYTQSGGTQSRQIRAYEFCTRDG